MISKLETLLNSQSMNGVCSGPTLRNLRVNEARKHFPIESSSKIIGLINCTVMGPFKYGLVICENVMMWKNQSIENLKNRLNWLDLVEIKNEIKLNDSIISFGNFGSLDMKESKKCDVHNAFDLVYEIINLMKDYYKNGDKNSDLSVVPEDDTVSEQQLYSNLISKLIALFIISNGIIKEEQVELAQDIIYHEDLIENKEAAFELVKATMEEMLLYMNKSYTVFQLKMNSMINEITNIKNVFHKERVMIILQGMSENTEGFGKIDTLEVLELIKDKLI
jgi:hypothetical protein